MENNGKRSSTRNSKMKKASSNVGKFRQQAGASFEKEIGNRLLMHGITTTKKSVVIDGGQKKISDFYFVGKNNKYWIEATTCISNQDRLDVLLRKKKMVQEVDPTITKWVIFFRKDSHQLNQTATTFKNYKKQLTKAGIVFCNGDAEINEYISSMLVAEEMSPRPVINFAKCVMLPLSRIKKNPNNREEDEKNVLGLMSGVIQNGFVTQFNVVPEYIDGKPTGYYQLFEGHNRDEALLRLKQLGLIDDPLVPCVVVDWLTSEDKEQVATLLCKTNTTAKAWEMKNYINYHFKTSLPSEVDNPEKNFSYGVLRWLRSNEARKTLLTKNGQPEFFGENFLIYIFGPKKNSLSASKFLDSSVINEGDYRVSRNEYNLMKKFISQFLLPFHSWFSKQTHFDTMVMRRLMKGAWEEYKMGSGKNKETIELMLEYFMGMQNPPVKESEINDEFWTELTEHVEQSISSKLISFESPVIV